MSDPQNRIPSFDEVMKTPAPQKGVPSFSDIMGEEPAPKKKVEPKSSANNGVVKSTDSTEGTSLYKLASGFGFESVREPEVGGGVLSIATGVTTRKAKPIETFTQKILTAPTQPTEQFSLVPTPELAAEYEGIEKGLAADVKTKADNVFRKSVLGVVSKEEIADLYQDPRGRQYAEQIMERFVPELKSMGGGLDVGDFRNENKWSEIATKIKEKNRGNGVSALEKMNAQEEQSIIDMMGKYKTTKIFAYGGTGGGGVSSQVAAFDPLDINDLSQYSAAINRLKQADGLTDESGRIISGEKEKLLGLLEAKAMRLAQAKEISPEIKALNSKITTAVTRVNMDRELGEEIPQEEIAKYDAVDKSNFETGLNYIQDVDPVRYKNIMRGINEKEKVADTDFRNLASIGQDINNEKTFVGAAKDPSLIDKETNFNYLTRQDKKAIYAAEIGEYLKQQGFSNVRQYSAKQISQAALNLGLDNKTVVDELIAEEGILGYDAIPKSGAIESFVRGIQTPLQAIKQTIDVATGDDAEIYLKSQQFDVGVGQKVADAKGQMGTRLASDRGNVWYDVMEGFGQFIPQVLLTRGIGAPIAGAARATVASIAPRAALTAGQSANVVNYGGTFISTYLQEYGSSYEDALNKTGDPNLARSMGAINGISAAGFELFLPDTKIADRAAGIFKKNYAGDIIDIIKKGGNPADLARKGRGVLEKFVGETLSIAKQEVKEEVGTNIVNYLTESIFSPRTAADRNLTEELMETAKSTAISMLIPSVLGGAGAAARNSDFTVNGLHSAAINIESSKNALDRAFINDQISQEELNTGMKMLNTHRESLRNAPKENSRGKVLSTSESQEYAYQDTLLKNYNEKLSVATSDVVKEDLEASINESKRIQREILMPPTVKDPAAAPEPTGLQDDSWRRRVIPLAEQELEDAAPVATEGSIAPSTALTAEQASLSTAIANGEIKDEMFIGMANEAVKTPEGAAQLFAEIKSQATGSVAGEFGNAESGVRNTWGNTLVDAAIKPAEEIVADITVSEMLDKPGIYNGQRGTFFQDGQTVVFKVAGQNKEFELGNVEEIGNTPVGDFGIENEESVVAIGDTGNITVREQEYVNNFSDPFAAINRDEDGNIVSVNLETTDGKKRTFRGNVAEDIAYQINLKEINKDNGTRETFEQFINEDAAAQEEMDNGAISEAAPEVTTQNNEPVQREKIRVRSTGNVVNIPDKQTTNPIKESVSVPDKIKDIEKRRKEEIDNNVIVIGESAQQTADTIRRINDKYDSEIAQISESKRTDKDFSNENEFYRVVVGGAAFNDIIESGVVRTNADNKNIQKESGTVDLSNRPTAFPSFSKGKAAMSYAAENPNHYIIVSEDSSIKPSTAGRHGKGSTMFPTDETGRHLKELNGEKVKVYKHVGDGKYQLVYANGKAVPKSQNTSVNETNNQQAEGGVSGVYQASEQLKEIGTSKEYADYVNSIFPDSTIKEVVYHGTNNEFDEFEPGHADAKTGKIDTLGFHFIEEAGRNDYAETYGKMLPVVVDIKNPVTAEYSVEDGSPAQKLEYMKESDKKEFKEQGYDGGIIEGAGAKEYVAFDQKQAHILGGKKDIAAFKKWKEQSQKAEPTASKKIVRKVLNDIAKARGIEGYADMNDQELSDAIDALPPTGAPPDRNEAGAYQVSGDDMTGITHAQTEATRTRFALPEYDRSPTTIAELDQEANDKLANGFNVEKLLKSMEKGVPITPVEQRIMLKYIASLEAAVAKDPSDANLAELLRAVQLSDRIGGSVAGQSLVARKGLTYRDDSLGAFFVREMEETGSDTLTEAQKEKVKKEYNDIKEANEKLQQKVAALQQENARIKAGEVVSAERKKNREGKKSQTDFKNERADILSKIKEKWNKPLDPNAPVKNSLAPEFLNKLVEVAPDVIKLMKSYVEEGITNLPDLIKKIHGDVEPSIPGLEERDVQDMIAGVYSKKKTRNELAAQIYDLRAEAKLLNQYEALENGVLPTTEKGMRERNAKLTELRQQIKNHDLFKMADAKKRVQQSIDRIEKQLKDEDFAPAEKVAGPKLDKEGVELQDKLDGLKRDREVRILKERYANRTRYEKGRDKVLEVMNVPRSIMASMDYSAPLRQSVLATLSHPQMAASAAKEMFISSFSQKNFDRWFADLKRMPRYDLMQETKLSISDPQNPSLVAKEEQFMNNIAEKIPVIGRLIKGSERAYVQYLNKMRVDLFNRYADQFEQKGKTFENSPELYKKLAGYVNNITGRGSLGTLEENAPVLNTIFFSPRLIASRINLMNPGYVVKLPKELRTEYMKDMLIFLGTGLSVLAGIMYAVGGDDDDEDKITVEGDPRSSDFMKLKQGNTRWDIWGGFQPYVRVMAQLITRQSKSTTSGKIKSLDGEGAFARDAGDVLSSFFRNKLAPIPGGVINVMSGKNSIGEKVTLGSQLRDFVVPLNYSGIQDAMKEQGYKALFTVGIPSTFGIGTQTYESKKK